jgi:hypothetical protein
MKGRDTLFSAFKEVDLTTLLVGAKADAEARMAERAAIFIMVGRVQLIIGREERKGGSYVALLKLVWGKIWFNVPIYCLLTG